MRRVNNSKIHVKFDKNKIGSDKLKIPTVAEAEKLLNEAEKLNPGRWVAHSRTAALCARAVAEKCGNLNPDCAYVLGLLHDIGRRQGVTGMKHILDGYKFMLSKGYEDSSRICLTHSFPYKNINAYSGQNDCSEDETRFVKAFVESTQYDDYDRLIQLCDAVAFPKSPVFIEKRLVDVVLRHGFNDYTVLKWQAIFELKDYFDKKTGRDIYKILGI